MEGEPISLPRPTTWRRKRGKWQPGTRRGQVGLPALRAPWGGEGEGLQGRRAARREREAAHQLLVLLSESGGQGVHVGVLQGLPAQLVGLHVDHAAPGSTWARQCSVRATRKGPGIWAGRAEASVQGGLGSQRDLVGIPAPDTAN